MADTLLFHRYDNMPKPDSKVSVPRISEDEVRQLISGKTCTDEVHMVGISADYSVRQYRDVQTGEVVVVGGQFSKSGITYQPD